jgi:hypothetical protein
MSVSGHHWRRLVAAMPTRRHPAPEPVETAQAEFVKIYNEEAPLPLTRVVIADETPFLMPQMHPIHDAFRLFMRDLRAQNRMQWSVLMLIVELGFECNARAPAQTTPTIALHCIALCWGSIFNTSPEFNSCSNGRLGVSVECMCEPTRKSRPGRSPTTQKKDSQPSTCQNHIDGKSTRT